MIPTVFELSLQEDLFVEGETDSTLLWESIGADQFCALRITFIGKTTIELVFNLDEAFHWLVLLARSEKLALADRLKCVEVTVNTEPLRRLVLRYFIMQGPRLMPDRWLAVLPAIAKTLGISIPPELDRNIPDLIGVFQRFMMELAAGRCPGAESHDGQENPV
jgi:hypothetical protein